MAVTGFLYKKGNYKGREYWVVQDNFSINGHVAVVNNDKPAKDVWVHGDVTFEGYLTENDDNSVLLSRDAPLNETSIFVYGFDTAHPGDNPNYSDAYKKTMEDLPSFKSAYESILNGIEWTPELVEDECKAMIDDLLDEN